ncbi:MAG: ABC transporter substrate-binding protein [Actinomycetota bacterium]|nr:ABC transporter substrate-binding protein [Actinomycetota bacterium]
MIDEAGPWGTGPFTLVQGASSITTHQLLLSANPLAATNVIASEQRDPLVVLEANLDHWNRAERGPRIERAVFRNDLTPAQALDLCLSTDGEVDIVTEVSPADAERVQASEHARLVVNDANRVLVGIINRQERDVPLSDPEVRRALNLAVDRAKVVAQGLNGYATPLSALTPPWCSGLPQGAKPYDHDPDRARELFRSWPEGRPVRLATAGAFAGVAELIADDLRSALGVEVEVTVVPDEAAPVGARVLVENKLPASWDVLLFGWFDLSSEAPPAAVHREFFGLDGAFRIGPPVPEFDTLFDEMKVQLDGERLVEVAERIDAMCFDQAFALFLCAPQALYAVNNHVSFGPYRTTFEIAEVTVDEGHWSRTDGGGGGRPGPAVPQHGGGQPVAGYGGLPPDAAGDAAASASSKPGFSGAAGNAC